MSRHPWPRRPERADEGIALVLVLLFVLVTGVLIAALLSQSFTTFTAARTANQGEQRLYAAGGGIDWGIQRLRAGTLVDGERACTRPATAGPTVLADAFAVGDHQVQVTCETTAGHDVGAGGWAVFITDPGGGITTSALPASPRSIFGPVYNAGGWDIDPASQVRMESGEVVGGSPTCPVPAPADLVLDAGSPPYRCLATALPVPSLPIDLTAAIAAAPDRSSAGQSSGTCRTFEPGRYGTAPSFLPSRVDGSPTGWVNHLRPGVYVFDFAATVFDNVTIVGGEPAPLASNPPGAREPTAFAGVDLGDCERDPDADAHGSGAVIVLRGTTSLTLSGASSLELFSWLDPAQPGGGVSLVRTEAEAIDPAELALSTTESDGAAVAIHGATYLPTRGIELAANGAAVFTGGVVAADLRLLTTSDGAGLGQPWPIVSNAQGAGAREVTLVATIADTPSEKGLTITATLNIQNSGARPLLVEGWTVSR